MDSAPGQAANSFHPQARLVAALTLGVLGAAIIGSQDTFFGPQPHVQTWNLFAWLLAAAAAIFLLHRIEHVRTPRRLWAFMGLALAISLVPAASKPDIQSMFDWLALAKMGALAILLSVAGIVLFGLPAFRGRSPAWRAFLRAPMLALAAPFLLFAARACRTILRGPGWRDSSVCCSRCFRLPWPSASELSTWAGITGDILDR